MAGQGQVNLEQLASVKEKELNELRLQQAQQTANTIKDLEATLQRERENASQLQADFAYNLSLLNSRDQELCQYEASFVELKRVINALTAENSELKVRLDGICKELEGSKDAQLQLKAYYQSRIKEIHSRMDQYRHVKQKELDGEHEKLQELQRVLERRLLDLEGESQCQHDQLIADFDQILKQRDQEHQLRVDQLSSAQLTQESKYRQLERELARSQGTCARLQEEAQRSSEEAVRAERENKERVWRLEADKEVMEARVRELEEEREKTAAELRRKEEYFQKKHAELDRAVREKESSLKAAADAHSSREHSLEQQCLELQALVEEREGEWQQRETHLQQAVRDKEEIIQRAYSEQQSSQSSAEKREKDLMSGLVEKDLQLQSLSNTAQALKREIQRRDEQLASLRAQLSQSQSAVQKAELSHAQQRLDWEARVREVEKMACAKQQGLIEELTEAKDKMSAECQELRTQLDLLHTAQTQRDVAIATLQQHGIPCEDLGTQVTEVQALQRQNQELRAIIKQMRAELEQLSDWSDRRASDGTPTTNYVRYMEEEVRKVKSENRKLSEQVQQMAAQRKPPTPNSVKAKTSSPTLERKANHTESPDMVQVKHSSATKDMHHQHRGHLIALSDTIASLQREKGALESQVQEWRSKCEDLQGRLKNEQEMVYILRAGQVPQSKLHQKLVQATQVIIALVREKEQLVRHVNTSLEKTASSGASHQLQHQHTQTSRERGDSENKSPQERISKSPRPSNTYPQRQSQKRAPSSVSSTSAQQGPSSGSEVYTPHCAAMDRGTPELGSKSSSSAPKQVRTPHALNSHSGPLPHPKLDTDTSLGSLQFTESSSLEGMSLEQVVAVLDRNLDAMSALDTSKQQVRHSTPDKTGRHGDVAGNHGDVMELVGKGIKTHSKTTEHRAMSHGASRKTIIKKGHNVFTKGHTMRH